METTNPKTASRNKLPVIISPSPIYNLQAEQLVGTPQGLATDLLCWKNGVKQKATECNDVVKQPPTPTKDEPQQQL